MFNTTKTDCVRSITVTNNAPHVDRIHERAEVATLAAFGKQSVIYQFATVEANVTIGESCKIGSGVFVGQDTVMGNNVRIQHGAFIARGSVIGSNVFIGPYAILTDDKYPRAGQEYIHQPPILEDGCSIGAGAIIMPGVLIGKNVLVGSGSVVTNSVCAGIVKGSPARGALPPGKYMLPVAGFGLP